MQQVSSIRSAMAVVLLAGLAGGCHYDPLDDWDPLPIHPGPPVKSLIYIENPDLCINEAEGLPFLVRVARGPGDRTASVDYVVRAVTATPDVDYLAVASGTLAWPEGQFDPQTIQIDILDDSLVEGTETLEVELQNPREYAELGFITQAILSVLDDETSTSGLLDTGFGTGGVEFSDPGGAGYDQALAVATDASHLYVIGQTLASSGMGQWRIEKRDRLDGSLDQAFGTSGVVESDPDRGNDVPSAVAIDATSLYAVGGDSAGSDGRWRVEKRSLLDGSLVPSFATGGVLTVDPSAYEKEMALAIELDGTHLYLAGRDGTPGPGDSRWRVEKRNMSDGVLDPGFGSGGVVTVNPGPYWDEPRALLLDGPWLYMGGFGFDGIYREWRIERRAASDGSLDGAFGSGGVAGGGGPGAGREVTALAVDGAWLYAAGSGDCLDCGHVERRSLVDGALDLGFGTAGGVEVDAEPTAMVVAVPYFYLAARGIQKRWLSDGSLDDLFASCGAVHWENYGRTTGIVSANGALHVVGYEQVRSGYADCRWRMEKRVP